jgi:3-hydroxybutyrate dehydrogenase
LEISKLFHSHGAKVIFADLNEPEENILQHICYKFIKTDLSDLEQSASLPTKALETGGRIDILVNNAGVQNVHKAEEFDDLLWSKMIQIMLIAPFQISKRVIPSMKSQGFGRIINMSSIHGLVASPFKSAYNSAKHGLIGLTKTLALELGEFGITVNAICPGYVQTELMESQISDQAANHNMSKEDVVKKIILGPSAVKKLIQPTEVARLALFLASENSGSITGSSYSIDGGWTAR